jgi:hypothetical protein
MEGTVIYDACVLYPAPLRDLLVRLALAGLFRARWTEEIHREWTRSVREDRPDLRPDQLERTRRAMDAAVPDCLVEGYEPLIAGLTLPDADDRHVLAAAIRAGASLIVTFNLADFPRAALAPHGVAARHPDDFVLDLIGLDARRVCEAVERQRAALRRPPKTVGEHLATLEQQGLKRSVARLRELCYSDTGVARRPPSS